MARAKEMCQRPVYGRGNLHAICMQWHSAAHSQSKLNSWITETKWAYEYRVEENTDFSSVERGKTNERGNNALDCVGGQVG